MDDIQLKDIQLRIVGIDEKHLRFCLYFKNNSVEFRYGYTINGLNKFGVPFDDTKSDLFWKASGMLVRLAKLSGIKLEKKSHKLIDQWIGKTDWDSIIEQGMKIIKVYSIIDQ